MTDPKPFLRFPHRWSRIPVPEGGLIFKRGPLVAIISPMGKGPDAFMISVRSHGGHASVAQRSLAATFFRGLTLVPFGTWGWMAHPTGAAPVDGGDDDPES